jgi:hypothetical protein
MRADKPAAAMAVKSRSALISTSRRDYRFSARFFFSSIIFDPEKTVTFVTSSRSLRSSSLFVLFSSFRVTK